MAKNTKNPKVVDSTDHFTAESVSVTGPEILTLESVLHDLPDATVASQEGQEGADNAESVNQSTGTVQAPETTAKRRGLEKGQIVFRGERYDDKVAAALERITELESTLTATKAAYARLLASEAQYRALDAKRDRPMDAGRIGNAVERVTTVTDSDELLVKSFMHNRALKGSPVSREDALEMLGLA